MTTNFITPTIFIITFIYCMGFWTTYDFYCFDYKQSKTETFYLSVFWPICLFKFMLYMTALAIVRTLWALFKVLTDWDYSND